MCIFQPFTVELHSCSYARRSTVTGFKETLFCTCSFEILLRFGSVNTCRWRMTASGRRNLVLAGRNRWHYSTEWNQRFIQNVTSCYVLCLTKEFVITATLFHTPVCVCVCVCVCATHTARRFEWYECAWNIKWRRVRIEFPPGPDADWSPDFEKPCTTG